MYQRNRTLGNVTLPRFDGDPAHVMAWVRNVENTLTRFDIPSTQLLDSIRSSLREHAAHWWDVCRFLLPESRVLQAFLKKYGGDKQARSETMRMLHLDKKGPTMSILRTMDDTYRTQNPDYLFILQTLRQIDCPVLEIQAASLPLEHHHYDWRSFRSDLQRLYMDEIENQRQLCRPYYHKGSTVVWLGNRSEFLRRRELFRDYTLFCLICMSNLHHTDDCGMMADMCSQKKIFY